MADQNGSASTADAPPQNSYSMPMSINVADIVEEEDEDEYDDHQEVEERSSSINRRLSCGDAGSERSHVMEIRTHAPREKIA